MPKLDIFGDSVFIEKRQMSHFFILPPFSVLDTTSKIWRQRLREWKSITGDLTATKENVLAEEGSLLSSINNGSSNFDPVLAELILKWFAPENAHIIDPFGGEQTKGIVAGELNMRYTAIEFRKEQVIYNRQRCKKYKGVRYYHGDSNNISKIIKKRGFNIAFTSPPYFNLEIYSKTDMSALGSYLDFMAQYKNIFQQVYDMLLPDSFLVLKVGEVRNTKTGEYYNFVGDNISIMKEIGFLYWNEIILVNSVGTLPLRAGKSMNATRKIGKRHQNLLVFFKGAPENIKNKFPKIMEANAFYNQEL